MLLSLPSIAIIIKLYGKARDPPAEARWESNDNVYEKKNKFALLPNFIIVLYFFSTCCELVKLIILSSCLSITGIILHKTKTIYNLMYLLSFLYLKFTRLCNTLNFKTVTEAFRSHS